jgi:hypothetical protein
MTGNQWVFAGLLGVSRPASCDPLLALTTVAYQVIQSRKKIE